MHHGAVVVRLSEPAVRPRLHLPEVELPAGFYVVPHDRHVVVPLVAILLVGETEGVHQFVDGGADLLEAQVSLQVQRLLAALSAHARPAARVRVGYVEVVGVVVGFWAESGKWGELQLIELS